MVQNSQGEVTQLLVDLRAGKREAEPRLMQLLYSELHGLAQAQMKHERPGHTLSPTALVHEAYLRLAQQWDREWNGRAHFIAVASQAMRRLLVDYARARVAQKRGGPAVAHVELDEALIAVQQSDETLIALDEALTRLAEWKPRQCRVVELRYFAGLTEEQIAAVLQVNRRTVDRDWKMARAWLWSELKKSGTK